MPGFRASRKHYCGDRFGLETKKIGDGILLAFPGEGPVTAYLAGPFFPPRGEPSTASSRSRSILVAGFSVVYLELEDSGEAFTPAAR